MSRPKSAKSCLAIREGRRKKEEGRRKKEEGRGKKEEGRGKREEGRRKICSTVSLSQSLRLHSPTVPLSHSPRLLSRWV
ncbi:hypothetical protein [Microcoleus vaginatus]|uniref:hypothetical protein n=1 Tax=Microcoleus vaginatus TaxID=119532 RepID=UPI00030A153C